MPPVSANPVALLFNAYRPNNAARGHCKGSDLVLCITDDCLEAGLGCTEQDLTPGFRFLHGKGSDLVLCIIDDRIEACLR